jgi:hypothetical protein
VFRQRELSLNNPSPTFVRIMIRRVKLPAWSQRISALVLVASVIVVLVSVSVIVEPTLPSSTVDSASTTPGQLLTNGSYTLWLDNVVLTRIN